MERLPFDMKHYRATDQKNTAFKVCVYGIALIMIIAVLGIMENRDRQHLAEMAQQCEQGKIS